MPKFNTKDSKYIVLFTSSVAIVFSLILSFAATVLKPLQLANVELDKKKNVLKAFGQPVDEMTGEEILDFFDNRIEGLVVDSQGEPVDGQMDAFEINYVEQLRKDESERSLPLYVLQGEDGESGAAFAIPVVGKGLWSTMYGYFALESDLNTVRGIVFYDHGETPGLGGEIEAAWFTEQFEGKKILNVDGEMVSVTVTKGAASDVYEGDDLNHYVDGISGATITSRGVTEMLSKDLTNYQPYFEKVRAGGID